MQIWVENDDTSCCCRNIFWVFKKYKELGSLPLLSIENLHNVCAKENVES